MVQLVESWRSNKVVSKLSIIGIQYPIFPNFEWVGEAFKKYNIKITVIMREVILDVCPIQVLFTGCIPSPEYCEGCCAVVWSLSCFWLVVTPKDYSWPGSSVRRILQARMLERVAVLVSRGLNPGLLHCRWIIYHVNHQGSPILLPHNFTHEGFNKWLEWEPPSQVPF